MMTLPLLTVFVRSSVFARFFQVCALACLVLNSLPGRANAADLAIGATAPAFNLKNQAGSTVSLASRKGHWTVLYFYPKAETPGCTKQACAFRDGIKPIRELQAEVYGVSINTVEEQARFHEHHHLNFDLLADADGSVTQLYGAKMPVLQMAKRWTFVIDPALQVRAVEKDVDPVKDAGRVAAQLKALQASGSVLAPSSH